MENTLINCGERTVQVMHRVALKDITTAHGIKQGDRIEVFIRKV